MQEESGRMSQGADKKVPDDATSSETLSEIEETEDVSKIESDSDIAPAPSPDGGILPVDSERRPTNDADPM